MEIEEIDLPLYSIEVTEDIASKIRIFAEMGVFAMKSGSVEIHFDPLGNVSQVVSHIHRKVIHKPVISTLDKMSVL